MESSAGTEQGHTPKKGHKKNGEKKPILEMKLTVDIQQWLRNENGKALKIKLSELKIDKTKERGQIRSINQDDVVKKAAGYQVLPPPGPLRITAWEDSGMTRFAFWHKVDNISSACCAVVHELRRRWLALRSERATQDRNMPGDPEHAARRRQRTRGLARLLLC